jgi:hypothetical protein
MTILSQAQTIRDETVPSANTATRVGTCLVDIANALSNSAFFTNNATNTTAVTLVNTAYPVQTSISALETVTTGSGITISSKTTGGDDYSYFSGLDATHAYKVDYSFSILGTDAVDYKFSLHNFAGTQIYESIPVTTSGATKSVPVSISTVFTGQTSVVLNIYAPTSAGTSIDTVVVSGTILDLGLAV